MTPSLLSFPAKVPVFCEARTSDSGWSRSEGDCSGQWTGQDPRVHSEDQDQPLSFDRTRLAVAAAAFRGPSDRLGSSQARSLVRVLKSSLPNLASVSRGRDSVTEDGTMAAPAASGSDGAGRVPGRASSPGTTEERTAHALGLDCYSSSDEDSDT